ncbi:ribosomal protein S5 domain 2-type protein [Cokeromyces recurvatus]|uniref:ribosomal protein S5 domain 2-type protein n=1 Tax=Cokeromyces recurvatus TaxID=90255 RepID=UPI002220C07D|nr:ribosomal protein S5 domain 2-type protein [Cokeromyces recurvatus]KAI7898525.1 ribosomal protein S5 domain 2-type protein [Cokeromyces recurvatus]
MPEPLISPAEKSYIEQGVEDDCRADGRARFEYRHIVLESGLLSQASGSARCRLGDSDVLVGVKVEIGEVDPTRPNQGRLVCNVECSPSASQQFEGRGADEINNTLTLALDRVFSGPQSGLDLESLCIIPNQQCWIIYIDAMVMDAAGNLLDCIVMTTRAALHNTRIPKTQLIDLEDGDVEFEIVDDVEEAEPLKGWQNLPVTITLYKIGQRYVIDPTSLEELCSQVTLTVGVNRLGQVCGIKKGGRGSLEPSLLNEMVGTATTLAKPLIEQLDTKLIEEETKVQEKKKVGQPVETLGFFAAVI